MDDPLELDRPGRGGLSPLVWIVLGLLALVGLGALAFVTLRPSAGPPPEAIAADRLLVRGREVYLDRCASCHGSLGRGDGPTSKGLPGPPVGDLTDDRWKHGDAPEAVVGVIREGVKETQMPAWGTYLSPADLRAVSGYVYHLAGREVPPVLRGK